jgi:transcriptional regulator with XRE-family HTH domain
MKTFKIKHKETSGQTRDRLFNEVVKHIPERFVDMQELAERADVGASTLWNWVYGETMSPQLNTLVKVARALGYTLELKKYNPLKLVKG